MVELGKFGTKIDRLIDDVKIQSQKIGELEKSVDRVKTGAIVAGVILSAVFGIFWWALGDRISSNVRAGLLAPQPAEHRAPAGGKDDWITAPSAVEKAPPAAPPSPARIP